MTQQNEYLATAFRQIDASPEIAKSINCLRFIDEHPSFLAYKQASLEQLQLKPGDEVADLGCGLGFDTARMAAKVSPNGKVIGIDASQKLLDQARVAYAAEANIEFMTADIHNIPLPANSLNGIRIDRVLQHVENPQQVIEEMVRVLKPGGRVVCAEPDWATFIIDAPESEITEQVLTLWRNSIRNQAMGRQLYRRLQTAGLQNCWVLGFDLITQGLDAIDTIFDIRATIAKAQAQTDSAAFEQWHQELQYWDKSYKVFGSVTLFLAGGQKSVA